MTDLQVTIIDEVIPQTQIDVLDNIQLIYHSIFETVDCCYNKFLSDGCEIIFYSIIHIKICNGCVFKLFKKLVEVNKNLDEKSYCKIIIFEHKFILDKKGLQNLIRNLEKYLYFLYSEVLSFYIFEKQMPLLEDCTQKFYKHIFNDDCTVNVSEQKTLLLNRLFNNIKNGNNKKVFDEKDKRNLAYYNNDFIVYSVANNFICKSSYHKEKHKAVTILTNKSIKFFKFSFCLKCLHDFGAVLLVLFHDEKIKEYKCGNFKVERGNIDEPCLISNVKNNTMYRIHIYKCSFVLCKKYYDQLTYAVVCSNEFRKHFTNQYNKFLSEKYLNLLEKQFRYQREFFDKKQQLETDLESVQGKLIQEQSEHDTDVEILNSQLSELRKYNDNLSNENKRLLITIDSYIADKLKRKKDNDAQLERAAIAEQEKIQYYNKRIINCVEPSQKNSVLILGTVRHSGVLKITDGTHFNCKTLRHSIKETANVIIESYVKDDKFCFATCSKCLRRINRGLQLVNANNRRFYDEYSDLEIIYLPNFKDCSCRFCGTTSGGCYYVRLVNVVLYICADCKNYWIKQTSNKNRRIQKF